MTGPELGVRRRWHGASSSHASVGTGLLVLLIGLTVAPIASAHGGGGLHLVASEADCGTAERCLHLRNAPVAIQPGETVHLTVQNPARWNASHTIHVAPVDEADPARKDTPVSASIASTGPVAPGGTGHANFTAPDPARVYVWCEEPGHEAAGGWTIVPLNVDVATQRSDPQQRTPLGGFLALAALGMAGVLARRARTRGG